MDRDSYILPDFDEFKNISEIKFTNEEVSMNILWNLVLLKIKQSYNELENDIKKENQKGILDEIKNDKTIMLLLKVVSVLIIPYAGMKIYQACNKHKKEDNKVVKEVINKKAKKKVKYN